MVRGEDYLPKVTGVSRWAEIPTSWQISNHRAPIVFLQIPKTGGRAAVILVPTQNHVDSNDPFYLGTNQVVNFLLGIWQLRINI